VVKNKGKRDQGIDTLITVLIPLIPHLVLAVSIVTEQTPLKKEERKIKKVRRRETRRESIESRPTKRRSIKSVSSKVVVVAAARVLVRHLLQ
jgi:hypothetical protein